MSKILIAVIPEKGHINPMLGPAVELKNAGHEVGFYAARDISSDLAMAGLKQVATGNEKKHPSRSTAESAEFANSIRDLDWQTQFLKTILIEYAELEIPVFEKAVDSFKPDLIVADPMVYQAIIVAQRRRIPWVGLSSSLYPVIPDGFDSQLTRAIDAISGERDAFFMRHGAKAKFRLCDCISSDLNIVFSTSELIGPTFEDVKLVGPSRRAADSSNDDFPWHKLRSDHPLIFASMGSLLFYQPRIFSTIARAVGGRQVQALLSTGAFNLENYLKPSLLPDNVFTYSYVPQLAILARSSVFITHTGANSVMEAIEFGIPMLATPICFDQFCIAYFIAKSGIGIELDLHQASPEQCWSALDKLMSDSAIKSRMASVSKSYKAQNGSVEAARLVGKLLKQSVS